MTLVTMVKQILRTIKERILHSHYITNTDFGMIHEKVRYSTNIIYNKPYINHTSFA